MKKELFTIVFGTDTRAGRIFDVVLLWMIILSVLVVILESVPIIEDKYGELLIYLEYGFTAIFTIEYILRILISPKPVAYIKSGWGIVDLLAILPVYIAFLIPAYQYFIVLRLLRLMRVFRILKLFRFTAESRNIYLALKASTYKISVFLLVVFYPDSPCWYSNVRPGRTT